MIMSMQFVLILQREFYKKLRQREIRNTREIYRFFSFFEKRRVHVEKGLPSANLTELFVRELTHAWQRKNVPDLSADLSEGLLAIVDIQYLRFISRNGLADERTSKLNSSYMRAGTGYREIAGKLKENPKYRNNPFLYLLATASGEFWMSLSRRNREKGRWGRISSGKKYEPKEFDRVLEGPRSTFLSQSFGIRSANAL